MRIKRRAAILLGAIALLSLPALPALAHADYRDSDPADGATVSSAPSSVRAEFTEPPSEGSTLEVFDPCGSRVDSGNYRYEGFPLNSITVGMSSSKAGEFSVRWTVVSTADGHTTRGTFTFTATGGEGCPGSGGSDGGGGNEAPRGGSGTSTGGSSSGTTTASGAPSGGGSSANSGAGKKSAKVQGKKAKKSPKKGMAADDPATVELVQPTAEQMEPATEDLPADWLIVGLAISALIGAAGGRVYAGIVGPRR